LTKVVNGSTLDAYTGESMAAIFTGQSVLDNRDELPSLIPEILDLIDPTGINVISADFLGDDDYHFLYCQVKYKGKEEPNELYIIMSDDLYKDIVLDIDLSTLINMRIH